MEIQRREGVKITKQLLKKYSKLTIEEAGNCQAKADSPGYPTEEIYCSRDVETRRIDKMLSSKPSRACFQWQGTQRLEDLQDDHT